MEMIWDHSTVTQETVYHSVKEAKKAKTDKPVFSEGFLYNGVIFEVFGYS